MRIQELLDSLPVLGFFVVFTVVAMIMSEGGFRIGRWWQRRTSDNSEVSTNMIVGALLALVAFLLATTMAMAADRFDTRRVLVLTEANSVGTTYLRAGYLPEPASSEIRELLREYVPLRVVGNNLAELRVKIARSVEIHTKVWSITEELARDMPESEVLALFIESLNEMIDLHETRIVAGQYTRVPKTIFMLLLISAMLTIGMVGYNSGLTRKRSPLTAIVLITVLGAVVTLVVDLDRPREGLVTVSQQPLTDLNEQINALPHPRPNG